MLNFKAARVLGKAIDEKARKVLDCEYQIKPVVELIPPRWLSWYDLEPWVCPHCHSLFAYHPYTGRWTCRCGMAKP